MSVSADISELLPRLSLGLSVCLSTKCTVAKRLAGSRCHWGW